MSDQIDGKRVYRAFFSIDELIEMHRTGETYPDGDPITLEEIEQDKNDPERATKN